ncbi:MAG TPA: tRNA uridine-5-carboxymethylaminomethyl(34) synthesis enzyme MnmG [Candidatus Babeliales bacterium]|nr:tRNA uridine-5-carboxymethylaminomethyl(34) synthesis enzyme MnmG [Candidatus Babeliales bacterium]
MNTAPTYDFDVIVIGGGHAGIEAAHAAAKMGSKTLMITIDTQKIGLMPCNPAIGGVGKGHMVYEISAMGGLMPKLCTKTYLQARMLNTKKGPAVQGLRLQIDKYAYNKLSRETLAQTKNLTLRSAMIESVCLDETGHVRGIITATGETISAPTVIITTGTFLNGKCHIGEKNFAAGRQDEPAATGISQFFKNQGIQLGRLKTGTPPRIAKGSIDFSKLEYQEADDLNYLFEFYPHKSIHTHPCYITHTNKKTHDVIRNNLHRSAMYNGNIFGIGPRYCPSIEDKIGRFPNKESHHVFVEPEGADSDEVYPNGISTSLPQEIQKEYLQTIVGFENAVITRPGYAVEYDFVLPNQLHHTLEVKSIPGLFLAGQINGTTGYEEAAGQGIMAGINAHLHHTKQPPFIMDRNEGYIGVMIDDLVSFGVDEPYRMFTSRAERRLLLRQDNVFLRLTDKAHALGMIDEQMYTDFKEEQKAVFDTLTFFRSKYSNTQLLKKFGELECNIAELRAHAPVPLSDRAVQIIHAEIRYQPYIEREQQEIEKNIQYQSMTIPDTFSYKDIPGLSKELQEKLHKYTPKTIAHAALIPGMTPAAIALLIFNIREQIKLKKG